MADVPEGAAAAGANAAAGATPVLERERERTAAVPGGGGPVPARADNGTECKAALRRMEDRFEQIQRRRPSQAEPLATQQVEIYMLTEQMGVLERLCRNQREHDFLRPTQERLARALQACRAAAANPLNDCVPRVAW